MIQRIKNNAFAKNSLILFAGTMAANVLNYLFHLIIGRLVSVNVYGEIESVTSLINILAVPAMTLTFIATKYAAHAKAENRLTESREIMSYLHKKVFKYGLPLFVIAFIFTSYLREFLKIDSNWPIIFLWVMMFLSFLSAVATGTLTGWQRFKSTSLVGILATSVKIFFAVAFIKLGFDLNGVIGGFLIGAVASYIASIFALKFILKAKNGKAPEEIKKELDFVSIKKYALPALVGTLAINILGNADMILAKHNLEETLAGQYGALTIVSKIIFFATSIIATVLFSMSSEKSRQKGGSLKILKYSLFLMIPISLVSIAVYFALPSLVFKILFGSKYLSVSNYLGWFAITVVVYSFVNLFVQYLLSINKTRVVYGVLIISIAMIIWLVFAGDSIYAILKIATFSQLASIIWILFFTLKRQKHNI